MKGVLRSSKGKCRAFGNTFTKKLTPVRELRKTAGEATSKLWPGRQSRGILGDGGILNLRPPTAPPHGAHSGLPPLTQAPSPLCLLAPALITMGTAFGK